MTIFRLHFAGQIKKAEHRSAGGKQVAELSLCRKNRSRQGEPESFTWVRVTVWEPADFQVPGLVRGAFVAGSGEMTARSYAGKDGKATAIEVACRSFDIAVCRPDDEAPSERAEAPKAPARPTPVKEPAPFDSEPPF